MRRVGAMRGLISLAVIFFVALSAQASARTFIRCVAEKTISYPDEYEIKYGSSGLVAPQFNFSFDVGKGSKIKNVSFYDFEVISDKTDEFDIVLEFGPSKDREWTKLGVDRISGAFWYEYKYKPSTSSYIIGERVEEYGHCKKVKQKF